MPRKPSGTARKKAPRQEAPQSLEQATALAARYIQLLDIVDRHKLDAQTVIDSYAATRDAVCAPLEQEAKEIFRQLRPWWSANRDELTGGKRKSIELADALIGERTTTPALALPKAFTLDRFVDWLLGKQLFPLLRTKHTADKQACIRVLRTLEREDPGLDASDGEVMAFMLDRALGERIAELGASVVQRDEFFIDRACPPSDRPEQVDPEPEGDTK